MQINADGTMSYQSGVTYDFTASDSSVGMEIMQAQTGTSSGEWGWAGSSDTVMNFTGWTNGITITNSVQIGGTAANFPIDLPSEGPGAVPLTVTCSSTVLETKADQSPFTQKWNRG
jgi:hypothetical protein